MRSRGSTRAYILSRLDRLDPQLAARVRAGEMTAYRAGIAAGFVKETVTFRHLERAYLSASPRVREQFRAWLEESESTTAS
jgi:hypothetical protein